jgi:hypothetical protein
MSKTLDRIAAEAGIPDLVEALSDRLSPTDLQSLMLAVYARRSERRTPADVLADYERSRFFGASSLPSSGFTAFAAAAEAAASAFTFLTLSPMAPLSACAAVASVGQDWSIPTVRTGEVVSDPTNILMLEAALRRRADPAAGPVHLATIQRVIRPQNYGNPKALAHFTLFALVSAGRDTGSYRTEAAMITTHLDALISAITAFVPGLKLSLSYTIRTASHTDARLTAITDAAARHGLDLWEEPNREAVTGYYAGLCFHLWAETVEGRRQLADGGAVDWAGKLTNNGKERGFISGCGVDGLVAERRTPSDIS